MTNISERIGDARAILKDLHTSIDKLYHKGLNRIVNDVRQFHITFGHPAPNSPTMQTKDLVERRKKWLDSESVELDEAEDIYDQVDAYIDILYFAAGGLVEEGIFDPQSIWNIVHDANMSKVWADGTIHKDENGKVIKPSTWVNPKPLIKAEIDRQIAISKANTELVKGND